MITKEKIKNEVDKLPDNLLTEVYNYLKTVARKDQTEVSEEDNKKKWEEWWDNLKNFSSDFMYERIQPPMQVRENMFD
jgi:uncharacterized protein HemX